MVLAAADGEPASVGVGGGADREAAGRVVVHDGAAGGGVGRGG